MGCFLFKASPVFFKSFKNALKGKNMFTIVKRYPEICTGHRHWRAETHCARIHGYARTVELTLATLSLEKGWVMDLGDLKFVREFLMEAWDHRLLVADDDPLLEDIKALEAKGVLSLNIMETSKGHSPSLEGSCVYLMDHLAPIIREKTQGRVELIKVEIWEKTDNRAALSKPYPSVSDAHAASQVLLD